MLIKCFSSAILLLLAVFVTRSDALRCQCTTDKGGVPCYKSWCQVYNNGTRVAACAMIRIGSIQHFACAHVSKDSDDSCTVVKKNGRDATKCWCRNEDYCNVELADRVDDDSPHSRQQQYLQKTFADSDSADVDQAITIDKQYDVNDQIEAGDLSDENLEIEEVRSNRIEERNVFDMRPPQLPKPVVDESIPPWRRRDPDAHEILTPPPLPGAVPRIIPTTTSSSTTTSTTPAPRTPSREEQQRNYDESMRKWQEEYDRRKQQDLLNRRREEEERRQQEQQHQQRLQIEATRRFGAETQTVRENYWPRVQAKVQEIPRVVQPTTSSTTTISTTTRVQTTTTTRPLIITYSNYEQYARKKEEKSKIVYPPLNFRTATRPPTTSTTTVPSTSLVPSTSTSTVPPTTTEIKSTVPPTTTTTASRRTIIEEEEDDGEPLFAIRKKPKPSLKLLEVPKTTEKPKLTLKSSNSATFLVTVLLVLARIWAF